MQEWTFRRSSLGAVVCPRCSGFRPLPVPKVHVMNVSWRKRAACDGLNPEIFYPASEDESAAAEAKAVCSTCPVRQPCLEHALGNREREGIWGGMTERERRRIVRQRRKTA